MSVHPKVATAAAAGAVTTVVVWLAGQFGVAVPPDVAAALTTLIMFAAGWARGSVSDG